jgi:hypothetical protein
MIDRFGSWRRTTAALSLRSRQFCLIALATLALTIAPGNSFAESSDAAAPLTKCQSPIGSCGCTITKKGFYEIGADLSSAQGLTPSGGCIDIRGPQVVLSAGIEGGGAYDITGPGGSAPTGIGIHVFASSRNDLLELPGNVDGWDIGIEIDGSMNIVQDFSASDCGTAAVLLWRATDNVLASFDANSNLNLGVWIAGGGKNQVRGANVDDNDNIGLLIGCSPLGVVRRSCSPRSTWNKITDISANDNEAMGVVIDQGNGRNIIAGVGAHGNPADDLYDANADCHNNLWFFNFFSTANQPCVQ